MLASRLGRSMMRHPKSGGGGMLASSVVGSVARAARALSSAASNEEAGMKGVTSLPSGLQYKLSALDRPMRPSRDFTTRVIAIMKASFSTAPYSTLPSPVALLLASLQIR